MHALVTAILVWVIVIRVPMMTLTAGPLTT